MKLRELRKVFSEFTPVDIYDHNGNRIYFNDVLKYVPTELDDREFEGNIINNRIDVYLKEGKQ